MRIRIPKRVLAAFDAFYDWANVPVWSTHINARRFEVLRLDIILTILFVICVGWYGYTGGLVGALTGGLMFIFLLICVLWLWR